MAKLLKIWSSLIAGVLIGASGLVFAQKPQHNPRMRPGVYGPKAAGVGQSPGRRGGVRKEPAPAQQRPNNQQLLMQRIIHEIGLTPEQQTRMQQIRDAHADDVISSGRRIRQARRALDQAIMSQQYDDAEVNRRIDELAQAQYEQVRLRQRIRAEIRQVLTPEQVTRFLQIQREMIQRQREQRNMQLEQQGGEQRPPGQAESLDPIDILSAPLPRKEPPGTPNPDQRLP